MKLDQDQNTAVAVQTNVVVSAGAGSGKTSVLTRRYLRLVVEETIPISRILALTFTRKAAAEMYQRIYRRLAESRDDAFVAEQIADFDSAFISTLDSFCATIARDGCARFGIPPTFVVDEVALRERARAQAVAFIRRHSGERSLQSPLRLLGFEGFVDGLVSLATDHVAAAGGAPPSSYLLAQRAFLETQLSVCEGQIAECFATIRSLDPSGPKCVQNAIAIIEQVEAEQPLLVAAGLYDPKLCDSAVRAVEAASKIKLTCGSSKHPDVPLLKEAVAALRESAPKYASLLTTVGQWAQQEELLSLLDEFYEGVLVEKRQGGVLSYHDILVLAIRVLESDATVRDYYKARFDAIMIDEFQDNNEEQKRLLYLLAERDDCHQPAPGAADLNPSKLFFVGDEKQSIYRFRGADVSVFRMLADELGGERAQLILGANYRSEPGLIRFFNSFFAHVFAGAESAYEARFLPLRFRDASPGVHPTVEHWRVEKRTQGDGDFLPDVDAQAYHIAARLRRLIESQTLLVGPDARPAEYRDVAILLKSSSNQIRLERMFRLFGIPYVSGAVRSLFLEAPVSDLYNVLQLAVYPDDRVAYAAYLRSPLVGLSDEGLVRQLLSVSEAAGGEAAADGENAAGGEAAADGENAAGGEAAADGENAAGGLFDPAAGLSAEDHRRLARAHERYEQIVAAADARPITELLFVMWYEWGYRYHLLRREEYVPYLEYFDLFWELAHSFEQRGLAAFLDEVRRHLGENQKLDELEYLGPEGEGVEIMTVHKSKGLEFPVVIVANTENAGRNDSVSGAPYYWDNELGPAWNIGYLPEGSVREKPANYLYTAQAVQAALEEAAERKRLLYVAATRAESHLIFCGLVEDRKNSFNELITPAFQAAQEEVAEDSGITASIIDLEPVAAEQEFAGRRSAARTSIGDLALRYDALPTVERRYVRPEISVSAVNAAYRELAEVNRSDAVGAEGGRPPLASDALIDANDLGAEFGTLCHELIERAPTGGYPHEREARLATARAVAGFGAAISRRTPKEQATLLADAVGLAESFLGSEEWRRIEADVATGTASVAHELAFLLQANAIVPGGGKRRNVIVRGKIDLLIEYSDQIEIIDFKSDRVVEAEHYAMQLVLYRQAARELYGRPVRVALFDLRAATLLPVSELPDEELLQKSIAKAFFV